MARLELVLDGERRLSVHDFLLEEQLSRPFRLTLLTRVDAAFSVEAMIGVPAAFEASLWGDAAPPARWSGRVVTVEDTGGDSAGHRLYQIELVAELALLGENRNRRIFQQLDEVGIACTILGEWGIPVLLEVDPGRYPKREMRVQYDESDLAFLHRLLEEAGVSYSLVEVDGVETVVLADEPQSATPREPLPYRDEASERVGGVHVSGVHLTRNVRPGRYALQDVDYRRPRHALRFGAHARSGSDVEQSLERFHYEPGALGAASDGGDLPVGDDKGAIRVDAAFAQSLVRRRLEAKAGDRLRLAFSTSAYDVRPGTVVTITDHDDPALAEPFLVVTTRLVGTDIGGWSMRCEATSARLPYRPALRTPRPSAQGVETATIVGPEGTEVHTDEMGRVRVQFRWDRGGSFDDDSSCWIPVSQPWAGAGYGALYLPRLGQEVLVQFLGGNPDMPMITGRVYTALERVPYPLPDSSSVTVVVKTSSFGGSGGYNEIKADDRAGAELLSVRAERDLETLVQHDERRTIGVDRTTSVGSVDVLTVGKDRRVFVAGVEERTFTSPDPKAPKTVQTNTNGQNKLQVGSTVVEVTSGKISLDTGAGASLVLEGSKITLVANEVDLTSKGLFKIDGVQMDATAAGRMNLHGAQIYVNPTAAWPAGRLNDATSSKIDEGAGTVFIGGPTVKEILAQLRADTEAMIQGSKDALERWNDEDKAHFKEWMGTDSEEARQEMLERLNKAEEMLKSSSFVPAESGFQKVDKNGKVVLTADSVDAYVNGGSNDGKIHLGGANYRSMNRNGRAGTAVHELGHFTKVGSTADHTYDMNVMKQNAASGNKEWCFQNSGNWAIWASKYGNVPVGGT